MKALNSIQITCYLLLFLNIPKPTYSITDPIEGRYSFSLTTFHPSGKLPQLEHAIKASTLGPPIIALSLPQNKGILLTSIQNLPSPLINDDGTSRFVKVSKSIIVGHTGVNADGRVLCEAAQRLSVEHMYTFGETIPVNVLLEEMALLFQEYTMKPGCRPFGCSLIVASLDDANDNDNVDDDDDHTTRTSEGNYGCSLFQIDPAGTVTKLESIGYAGRGNGDQILERLRDAGCMDANDIDEAEEVMMNVLRNEMGSNVVGNRDGDRISNGNDEDDHNGSSSSNGGRSSSSFIFAKLRNTRDVTIQRTQV